LLLTMKQLVQKGLFYRNSFEIVGDGILVKRNSNESRSTYKVKFEDIGFQIQEEKKRNEMASILSSLLFILFQVKILYGFYREGLTPTEVFLWTSINLGLAFFVLAVGFFQGKTLLFFSGGKKSLAIEKSKPNSACVQEFIREARLVAKAYYMELHNLKEENLPDRFQYVHWFYEKGILDYEEVQAYKNSSKERSIGFSIGPMDEEDDD
jgi:hypothetical protein